MEKAKTTAPDVLEWFKGQLKLISVITTIISIIAIGVWNVKAEPLVREIAIDVIFPIKEQVITLEEQVTINTETAKDAKYERMQMIYLMSQVAGPKAVKKMKKETDIFKPVNYGKN